MKDSCLKTQNNDVSTLVWLDKDCFYGAKNHRETCSIAELAEVSKFSYSNESICPNDTPYIVCKNGHWYCTK